MKRPVIRGVRRGVVPAVLVAASLTLSACDFSVADLPLPGGADVGDHPVEVTAEFADVLDLVPQSTVKVADVTVGRVTDVELDNYNAKVTLLINGDVKLPDNVIAELRQTSLLGEKFVSLAAPPNPVGHLESGDVIPIEQTGRNPEVEEVLGALSLVLNGGGVAQLHTITQELNSALKGREGSTKSVLEQLKLLMGQLDGSKGDIVRAIEAINRLSVSLNGQRATIDSALENLPAAFRSLDSQRADLVKMLQALDQLGQVGTRVIKASKDATIQTLRSLTPVLAKLKEAGRAFPYSLNVFLTYPFVDETVGRDPTVARNLHMGDYTNLSVKLDVNLQGEGSGPPTLPTNLPSAINPTVILSDVQACLRSGNPSSPACVRVLATPTKLLQLKEECAKPANRQKDVCQQLNTVPGLPGLPGGGPSAPGGGLPTIPGLPGLPRPGAGPTRSGPQGVTMGYLAQHYDADLVSLMVPSMVVS
jgi:phospholipid/cholesterol/gamma-HCH transport system substrate-binding protein